MKNSLKVYLDGSDNFGWSIDADRANTAYLLKTAGIPLSNSWLNANVIHFLWYGKLTNWRKIFWKSKINIAVVTNDLNHNLVTFKKVIPYINLWIAPSTKQIEVLENYKLDYAYQPFYVNEQIFTKLSKTKKKLCNELGIDWRLFEDKMVFISFQRDSLGTDLSQPKWQKGPDILIEILKKYKEINKNFILLLAGPRRHYLIDQCVKLNIPYFFYGRPPAKNKDDIRYNVLDHNTLNKLYNLGDLYIVSSRSEGGPKAILECAWNKIAFITTDVGLARDIALPAQIYNNIDEAIQLIDKINHDRSFANDLVSETFNKMQRQFSFEAYLKRWIDIYESIENKYFV